MREAGLRLIPSSTSTMRQKLLAEERCTGVGMVKPTPATHPALMGRFPSWLRSTEVLPQSMSFNPHVFFALPQVATNIVKGGEISPAYLKSSHSLCLHDPRERDNKFHG